MILKAIVLHSEKRSVTVCTILFNTVYILVYALHESQWIRSVSLLGACFLQHTDMTQVYAGKVGFEGHG